MKWYEVTKKIDGRLYRYRQRTYREGGRVRTQSQYIGAVSARGQSARPEVCGSKENPFLNADANSVPQESRCAENRKFDISIVPFAQVRNAKRVMTQIGFDDEVMTVDKEFDVYNWKPSNPFVTGVQPQPFVALNKDKHNSTGKRSFSMTAIEAEYNRAAYQLTRLGLDGSQLASIKLVEGKKPGWLKAGSSIASRASGHYEYKVFLSPGKRGSSGRNLFKANYLIALAHSILDGIETQSPDVYERLRSAVDHSWLNSKLLVIGHILTFSKSKGSDSSRLMMIAQYLWFNHLPKTLEQRSKGKYRSGKTAKKNGSDNLNLMSRFRPARWQDEAAKVMADVMQRGFKASAAKHKKDVMRSKANALRSFNQYQKLTRLQRISSKGRKKWQNYKRHETAYLLANQRQSRFKMLAPFLSNFHDKPTVKR